jgi:DNA-binding IclR family transcriptional regulator
MLGLLDLFTEAMPARTIENLIATTGYKRATLYRYVRELIQSGLLVKLSASLYALGPRFIEMDRQIRASDPLLQFGRPLLAELLAEMHETVILCSLLRDNVMCIDLQRAPDAPGNLGHDRGLALSLFRSASAKVVLAFLPGPRLLQLYRTHKTEIRSAGLGQNWENFKGRLRTIRSAGYAKSHGELIAGLVGIAVPVFNADKDVLGSLAFVVPEQRLSTQRKKILVSSLRQTAARIHESLRRLALDRNTKNEGALSLIRRSRRTRGRRKTRH